MTVEAASTPQAETVLPKPKEPESFLNQTPASSEEKNAYFKELKIRKANPYSELSRLRQLNHYLRRQSFAEFVSRNIRVRWRLFRIRSLHLSAKRTNADSLIKRLFTK